MKKYSKKYWIIAVVLIGVFLLSFCSYYFHLFETLQNKFTDRLFLKRQPSQHIVIVAIDEQSLAQIGKWPWSRDVFAKVIPQFDASKAVGFDINFSESSSLSNNGVDADKILAQALASSNSEIFLPIQLRADGVVEVAPLSLLAEHAKLGYVNVLVDSDNTVRSLIHSRSGATSFSSLFAPSQAITSEPQIINYTGPAKTILTVSFVDVLNKKIPPSIFKDANVLIGVTANDLHDVLNTPFGLMPGVEVHANALETLASGSAIKPASKETAAASLAIVILIGAAIVFLFKRFIYIIATLIALFVGIIAATFVSFQLGIILPAAYMLLAFLLGSVSTLIYQYVVESKEKRFIQKTFQYYLMPEVIKEIMENPKKLSLGGEKKKLTILFSDIRGFTALSEKLTAEELVHIINQYFTRMSDSIMEHRGLVDKYIGDAIMAFWGAPIANESQAADACLTALAMSAQLKSLNAAWKAAGVPEIGIGIGLNTGEVIVGNMGSEKRFNYTIMGDEVNFGSRLEGLNKMYGTECILSEETKKAVEGDSRFVIRELDTVMVKGKKEPKNIYELITAEVTDPFKQVLPLFAEGLDLYKKGNFKQALETFKKVLDTYPDGPSQTFMERCNYLIEHPPEVWNGVYEFKTK
ncbi:MAG: hypothetical protein RL094_458 [Candidatus Parcubacteria bacterium]|jgi:adenylate cyclase